MSIKRHPAPLAFGALLLSFALSGQAESTLTAPPDVLLRQPTRSLDVSVGSQRLTGGYSAWRNLTIHGIYEQKDHVFQGELSAKREFDTSGNFLGLTDTYTINPDWFTTGSIGFGDGAFYLPRYRLDAFLYRKWLPKKNLVSSFGVGYYNAPDGHIDRSISLGGAYYFEQPLVAEAGVRFNRSSPGAVNSHQQFLAASYSPNKRNTLAARVAWGSEGYLPLAENTNLVGFNSSEANLSWRHRLDHGWGVSVSANHYRNPSYERTGLDVGIMRQFD